jgi:hypothetical protein
MSSRIAESVDEWGPSRKQLGRKASKQRVLQETSQIHVRKYVQHHFRQAKNLYIQVRLEAQVDSILRAGTLLALTRALLPGSGSLRVVHALSSASHGTLFTNAFCTEPCGR